MHEKDKILANIFTEDGNIVIKPDEPDYIRRRAKLVFELVNSSSHHTIVTDPEGRILFANRAAQQITGFSLSEMRGNTPRLWGGLMSRDFYESLWMSKKTGLSIETEVRNRRKNGEIYYVYAHISCIRDENGEIIGFIGNEEDITTLKEAEQKASENSKRFLELTERIPEMYWITEFQPAEHVVYVSSVFEKLFHMSKDKLIANPRAWVKSVHPEDVNIVVNTFESVIKEKTRKNITFRTVSTEGEIKYIYAQADAILDENMNTKRMVGVARDVTLEKAVDRQKDEFISLASHQLKTPIGAMNWNVEMLLNGDYGKLTEEQKEVLGDVYVLGNRMNELVNGLLNISRIESGSIIIEPSQLDFAKLLNEVTMEMKPRIAKKAHKMILNIQENIEKIPADRKLLRIIFQNFISNAIKYTKDKGRITIDLHQDNENVYFSVANNGDPIPTDDQGKIFGKMFRASNASTQDPDGNGLGLYIVKQIVETAGGKIWFTSKEGQDTVFSCSFPLTGMRPKQGNKNLL
jgi:PAS domain S-box-containing protein